MFKNLFDNLALKGEIKELNDKLATLETNINACIELMERPIKNQKIINNLLKEMKDLIK